MVLPEILHMELSSTFLHSTPNESEIKLPADVVMKCGNEMRKERISQLYYSVK